MSIDVSIIIVNYNTSGLLMDCISSIYKKSKQISFEIIVIDNNSSDNSVLMVQNTYPEVILVALKENIGFGKANNKASLLASGKYLFFLNSDTYLRNDAISVLYQFMEAAPECGICGGNLTDFSGNPIHSFDKCFPGIFSDIFLLLKKLPRLLYGKNWFYNYTRTPMPVAYITGADMMIRSHLFAELKGFDPFFFMYYEETELTVRVKKLGHYVYSIPGACIAHKKGASLQYNAGVGKSYYISKYYYINKVFGIYHLNIAHIFFMLICVIKIVSFTIRKKIELRKRYRSIMVIAHAVYNDLAG